MHSKCRIKINHGKISLWNKEVVFLGQTITPNDVTPQIKKITKFLERVNFVRFKKALQRYNGFLKKYRNYIPRSVERINPFFQLPKTTENKDKIIITPELLTEFREINKVLDKCVN